MHYTYLNRKVHTAKHKNCVPWENIIKSLASDVSLMIMLNGKRQRLPEYNKRLHKARKRCTINKSRASWKYQLNQMERRYK